MSWPEDRKTRFCTAHRSNGEQCRGQAIRGGTVCVVHGGAAPQVKLSARARLETYVDPALTALRQLVDNADSDSVRLSAIKDILDRTGLRATDQQPDSAQTMRVTIAFDHNEHANGTSTLSLPDAT